MAALHIHGEDTTRIGRSQSEPSVMSGAVTNQQQQRCGSLVAHTMHITVGHIAPRSDKYKWPSRNLIIYRNFLRPKLTSILIMLCCPAYGTNTSINMLDRQDMQSEDKNVLSMHKIISVFVLNRPTLRSISY